MASASPKCTAKALQVCHCSWGVTAAAGLHLQTAQGMQEVDLTECQSIPSERITFNLHWKPPCGASWHLQNHRKWIFSVYIDFFNFPFHGVMWKIITSLSDQKMRGGISVSRFLWKWINSSHRQKSHSSSGTWALHRTGAQNNSQCLDTRKDQQETIKTKKQQNKTRGFPPRQECKFKISF